MIHHQLMGPTIASHLNPLNPELNRICYLLALVGAHHFLHISRIRVILQCLEVQEKYY